jgi:hypothetical protein
MRTFGAFLVAIGLATATITAQSGQLSPGAMYGADPTYKVPRTADGHPELQGVWSNNNVTPMARPAQWKDKAVITDQELKELQAFMAKNIDDGGDAVFQNQVQLALDALDKGKFEQVSYDKATGNYNQFWMVKSDWDRRTSLIIDPPNGQMPPLMPDAKARGRGRIPAAEDAEGTGRPRPSGPEDLPLGERCISFGAPRTGAGYNSYLQIFQSPTAVVLLQEMAHDARIVTVGKEPHFNSNVRQWLGNPRGHWDGDTFVVETTNYRTGFMGSTPDVKVTERYTRVSHDYINWVITVDDPKTWTQPWSFMVRLKKTNDQVYEYACHEGNHSMIGILAGARAADEQEAAAKVKTTKD